MGKVSSFDGPTPPVKINDFFKDDFDADPDPFNDDIIAATCDTENPESCESCT